MEFPASPGIPGFLGGEFGIFQAVSPGLGADIPEKAAWEGWEELGLFQVVN